VCNFNYECLRVAVRVSRVCIVTRIWAGQSGVQIMAGERDFCFSVCPDQFRPTHPPIQWVLVALSLVMKWLRCEADLYLVLMLRMSRLIPSLPMNALMVYTGTILFDFYVECISLL
jgi:hypothetical protein